MKRVAGDDICLTDIESAERFCREYRMPFKGFTKLQEVILNHPRFWDHSKNLIIKGMPGSGKTLLAELAFLSIPLHKRRETRKLLYLLPYRALLNEKYEYFIHRFNRSFFRMYRSSSDYYDSDDDIMSASCEIAIMIYEKLNHALAACPGAERIFYDYNLVVMDEFSLIGTLDRGIIINDILQRYDMAPAEFELKEKARLLALTVPECSTAEYNQIGFLTLSNDDRSVYLHEAIVQADHGTVHPKNQEVEWPISYASLTVTAGCDRDEDCAYGYEEDDVKSDAYELQQLLYYVIEANRKLDHHIIIFCSSRENARNISVKVAKQVRARHIRHGDWSQRLASIQHDIGDNSYGCIDDRMIESARYGVTYHNVDLPAELRREIEKEFSKTQDSRLDIIVSTETLAYGINCSADVVVIYERIKPASEDDYPNFKYGSDLYMRYLNSIEYQNFVGRAGRLGYERNRSQHVGYAYLFSRNMFGTKSVRNRYYALTGRRFRSCRRLFSIKLWRNPSSATAIVFNQIRLDARSGFDYDRLLEALVALTGKKSWYVKSLSQSV